MTTDHIDFLVVGAAKSATTWLRHQLQDDPAIYMPDPELHFFSREYERGLDWYTDQFTPHPGARLIGEKSNTYMDTPIAAERMFKALPHVRLVAVLRDPVERAYSDYCMYFRRGSVTADIEAYLDPERAADKRFLSVSRYDLHLKRLLSFYPADALYVTSYESVASHPQATLDGIRHHLGLAPRAIAPQARKKINDSTSELLPLGIRRALAPLKPLVAPLRGSRSFEAVRTLLTAPVQYPPLEPTLRKRMEQYLAPVSSGLSEMGIALTDSGGKLPQGQEA
ncbi:Sulfotransferase domain protein [Rhodobacteraceae bacterium THAF1]|uniref:sulfotransferase family protein n=1 Tax=Palleronia sp. THAF1 TaxID=2587842 RepID=UPI000F3B72F7|nr:sulfotransferase [Palleronia sp. THAF1]QFU10340.1 Sulfotransferase domain protein [Palleronia sp. THAF1]VDC31458.1 Sulfotransferase domain protein [Rhodobacteraceae bacterium THAF1]